MPYTILKNGLNFKNMRNLIYKNKCVLLLSGGIDSTTLLHELLLNKNKVVCLIFDYGQSLIKEINVAKKNVKKLKCKHNEIKIDLSFCNSSCSLISNTKITHNRTLKQISSNTPNSYVEFRNGIFLSYAVMYCEVNNIQHIYGGFNGLNSGNYYDDTVYFIKAFERAANLGTVPGFNVKIHAPYSKIKKWQIVKIGNKIGVDYKNTWSCYHTYESHCGTCDSCIQRSYALERGKNEKVQDK